MQPSPFIDQVLPAPLPQSASLRHYWSTWRWHLLYSEKNVQPGTLAQFQVLEPPRRAFWADPFVLIAGERRFVLFEECRYRFWGRNSGSKGIIRAIEYLGQSRWGDPVTVLERPYHLSYPFVFEHGGQTFLIPETRENGTIELYESGEAPFRWRLRKNLMTGVKAVDTTLWQQDGLWWMFTCRDENAPPNRDLFLYFTDDPVDGKWEAHPRNPIVSDARYARPAGNLFRQGQQLIRPAQDCARDYGCAVEFRSIVRLTVDEYEEERAGRLGPETVGGAGGVHTWNAAGGLVLSDARRRVARWRLS